MSEQDILRGLAVLDRIHNVVTTLVFGQFIQICLLLTILYLKYRVYSVTLDYLRRSEQKLTDSHEILEMVKVYNEMAHTQHKDAKRVMDKVEQKADGVVSPKDVMQAVAAVPDATAEKVVEKLSVSDSGRVPVVKPGENP